MNRFVKEIVFIVVIFLNSSVTASVPMAQISFDGASQEGLKIHSQFSSPDFVPGVSNFAWRTDGFSSYGEWDRMLPSEGSFSLVFWVALESYPSDMEVTVDRLSPSAIISQFINGKGLNIYIDTYGRWGAQIGSSEGKAYRLTSSARFPLYQWNQIAFIYDEQDNGNELRLLLNGQLVDKTELPRTSRFIPADVPMLFARPSDVLGLLNFEINLLNGSFDDLSLYQGALNNEQITELYNNSGVAEKLSEVSVNVAESASGNELVVSKNDIEKIHSDLVQNLTSFNSKLVEASLAVPASRFANDHLRPTFHAMPPANWTNEPHGLVRKNGRWHMFYQRTPNGPFKTQMHWGHMASDNLIDWIDFRDALRPELQTDDFGFDMKGIWSGDVIVDGEAAFAFYTSVNHFDRLRAANPGISMAVSMDDNLVNWKKFGPVIDTRHVADFRDPYLWKEDDTWHMIIGAAYENHGGLDYYKLERNGEEATWVHQTKFSSLSYRVLDIGSIIWEMPVFEKIGQEEYVLVVNPIGGAVEKYGELATRGIYWTGDWIDGLFIPHYKQPKLLDILPGHLSPTVARGDDGQLRAIGIVDERRTSLAQEQAGWAHTFSLPRVWFLSDNKRALGQAPAPELMDLRLSPSFVAEQIQIDQVSSEVQSGSWSYELVIESENLSKSELSIELFASKNNSEVTRLVVDGETGSIVLDKRQSNLSKNDEGPLVISGQHSLDDFGQISTVRLFVDGSVVDVFINDSSAFSFRAYPSLKASNKTRIRSAVPIVLDKVSVYPLRPMARKLNLE